MRSTSPVWHQPTVKSDWLQRMVLSSSCPMLKPGEHGAWQAQPWKSDSPLTQQATKGSCMSLIRMRVTQPRQDLCSWVQSLSIHKLGPKQELQGINGNCGSRYFAFRQFVFWSVQIGHPTHRNREWCKGLSLDWSVTKAAGDEWRASPSLLPSACLNWGFLLSTGEMDATPRMLIRHLRGACSMVSDGQLHLSEENRCCLQPNSRWPAGKWSLLVWSGDPPAFFPENTFETRLS